VLLVLGHGTAIWLVAAERSALRSLPVSVGRMMPILISGNSSPCQGLHCFAETPGEGWFGGGVKEGRGTVNSRQGGCLEHSRRDKENPKVCNLGSWLH